MRQQTDSPSLHTPGPWFDDGYRIYAPTKSDDKRDGRVIVEYKHVEDFNPADAPLLAAAPELYEVVRRAIAAGAFGGTHLNKAAREAFRKAKGEAK